MLQVVQISMQLSVKLAGSLELSKVSSTVFRGLVLSV